VQAFFSDDPVHLAFNSAVAYSAVELASDDRPAANSVTVKWVGGETTTVDQASIDTFGPIPFTVNTLIEVRDEAESLAAWILGEYSQLFDRITSITVRPAAMSGAEADRAWLACLNAREGDRVRVVHKPMSSGTAIDQQLWVIGVEHHGTNGLSWETVLHLAPAITNSYWVLGTSALGTTTVLAY
jgi:hypothetical protein